MRHFLNPEEIKRSLGTTRVMIPEFLFSYARLLGLVGVMKKIGETEIYIMRLLNNSQRKIRREKPGSQQWKGSGMISLNNTFHISASPYILPL